MLCDTVPDLNSLSLSSWPNLRKLWFSTVFIRTPLKVMAASFLTVFPVGKLLLLPSSGLADADFAALRVLHCALS